MNEIDFCSAKIFLYVNAAPANKDPGPFSSSPFTYIKLSFRSGGHAEVGTLRAEFNTEQVLECCEIIAIWGIWKKFFFCFIKNPSLFKDINLNWITELRPPKN